MKNMRIEDIEIEVIKKNIKNMYIYVYKPDGRVRITVPKRIKDEDIKNFAVSKLAWIKKQLNKCQNLELQPQKEYVSGEWHYYQGRAYLLNVIYTDKKQRVEIHKHQMDLYIREGSTREQRKKVMNEWYRSQLKGEIPKLIEKWEQIMGVKVNSFELNWRKQIGTCNTQSDRINLNCRVKCLEYIVVHEMAHLLERYHNKDSIYMDQYLPDWKEIKEN